MWQVAEFHPTSLFSLRPANATTSGGKTLVTPTPFSVKMALLDVAIRVHGRTAGEQWFPRLRDLGVAIHLPPHLMVIQTFVKILRPHKAGARDVFGTGLEGPMGNTIAYRELVQFSGPLRLAVRDDGTKGKSPPLARLLPQVNYLGKRGGFMQFVGQESVETLPDGFTRLNPAGAVPFDVNGLMQLLDDCGARMQFKHANVYDGTSTLSVGKTTGRELNPVVLPYRLVRSSRSFSLYERLDGDSAGG